MNDSWTDATANDGAEKQGDKSARSAIPASDLFQGSRQVLIEHDGEIYRLLLTRNNKLLLQK